MQHEHRQETGSHDKHAGHSTEDFLIKFFIALIATVPIFFYSDMAWELFGIRGPEFEGSPLIFLVLGSFIYFYCGSVFLRSAKKEISARLPGMMTLVSLAISSAYLYSFFSIMFGEGQDLLFELSSLITIMLLGHYIEMRSVSGAQGALKELSKLLPDTAEIVHGTTTHTVQLSDLKEGDMVLVRPGSKVPADGSVTDGESDVSEAILTGESKPIHKMSGSTVIAGSMNGEGSLTVRVNSIGERTFLAGIMKLVADAQASKSRLQILSDRAAYYLTIIALIGGGATFIGWIALGAGAVTATERMVAVLVIACPHALGLAVPLVAAISTTLAAKNGLLVRQRLALEEARNISIVLFDKTGTLTKGTFEVHAIMPAEGYTEDEVLLMAASVDNHSEHPLAKAIVGEARRKSLELMPATDFKNMTGKGSRASILDKDVLVGSGTLLDENGIVLPQDIVKRINDLSSEGKTVIHLMVNGAYFGSIALWDAIREESYETVRTLKSLGIATAMITGDTENVARYVSNELGIDTFFAKVVPENKASRVRTLQEGGTKVAFVGDGVNDAPALTQADLGIAIGAGTTVAIESAGIILVRSDPRDITKIFYLSHFTYSKMIQNLFWATGYNVVAIPLAAGVLAHRGIILEPWMAAVFMSVSTVIVAVNASLLRFREL